MVFKSMISFVVVMVNEDATREARRYNLDNDRKEGIRFVFVLLVGLVGSES